MIIGFSSGCLYKNNDPLDSSTINFFRNSGCNAIEIMIHRISDMDKFIKLKKSDFADFEYVSVHAPIYKGEGKDIYHGALNIIADVHSKVGFKTVVLHPDMFDDFEFLKDLSLPIAIENMDNRKLTCKSVADLVKVFEVFNVPMVLDINHSYTNDPSMQLAKDLIDNFSPRMVEIHLSGFDGFHEPLFKTKQDFLMSSISTLKLPIIIESGLDSPTDIKNELQYIESILKE